MKEKKVTNKEIIVRNIRNLTLGEVYNYPALCKDLGIKTTTGKAKKDSLALILSLLEYEPIGKRYKILDFKEFSAEELQAIAEDRRGKTEGSRGNNNKYTSSLVNTLLFTIIHEARQPDNVILQEDNDTIILTSSNRKIAENMGIRNRNNEDVYKATPNYFCQIFNIDNNIAKLVYPKINNKSYNTVRSVLDSLESNSLAVVSNIIEIDRVVEEDENGRIIEPQDENYREIMFNNAKNKKFERVIATEEERKNIELERLELCKKLGYRNLAQIYNYAPKEEVTEFHNQLNKILFNKYFIVAHCAKVEIRTRINIIVNHLLKVEHVSLEEFMEEGYKEYSKSIMQKIKKDKELLNNLDMQEAKFSKLRKQNKEEKFIYNTVQLKDNYIEQAEKFTDIIVNTMSNHKIEPVEEDIEPINGNKTSYIEIRPGNEKEIEIEENEVKISSNDEEFIDLMEEL